MLCLHIKILLDFQLNALHLLVGDNNHGQTSALPSSALELLVSIEKRELSSKAVFKELSSVFTPISLSSSSSFSSSSSSLSSSSSDSISESSPEPDRWWKSHENYSISFNVNYMMGMFLCGTFFLHQHTPKEHATHTQIVASI